MFEKELESRIQSAFNVSDIGKDLYFINRRSSINWIKVDIGKVINEKDYGCLKENVLNVINYDLDSAVASKVLDPGFVKLFRLAQLTIEYLLYTQNYFQKRSKQLSEEKNIMKQELEKFVIGGKEVIGDLNDQQNSFNSQDPRKESHLVLLGNDSSNTFRCMLCGKFFLNGCYLYSHHQRRHTHNAYPSLVENPTIASSFPSKLPEKISRTSDGETEKIWKELEWLRKIVYESLNTEKPAHQDTSQPELAIKSNQNFFSQWTRSNHHSPEKRNDSVPMRVKISTASMDSNIVDDVKSNGDQVEKKLIKHQILEIESKEEKEEGISFEQRVKISTSSMESNCIDGVKENGDQVESELNEHQTLEVESSEGKEEGMHFEQELKDSHQMKAKHTMRNRIGDFDSKSFSKRMATQPHVELQKTSVPEIAVKEDSGRLEAQERVWRGRLKALADKSSQEIESLRKMISSLQEKECDLEEEYQEKIENLTLQLREQAFKPTDDKAVGTLKEEELVHAVPPIPSIVEDIGSLPSSRDSTVTSLSPVKQPEGRESPLISSVSNASEVRSRTSDLEYDSSDISTSPNVSRRRLPSDHTSEDEESDPEALEVFEKKLRQLNINPGGKSMPEKVFKDKMEMLNVERRILKRNIENYHHIKSNLEEKADARVSQKMLRLKLNKSKVIEESTASSSGHRSSKDASSKEKIKEFPPSTSSKESLVATTSRSAFSSHSNLSSGRTIVSQSSIKSTQRSEEDLSYQSKISVMTERLKSAKGMGAMTADVFPKTLERHVLPGVSSFQSLSGVGEGHGCSSVGGSILRGLHHTRGESERVAAVPSYSGYGSKSVSFAQDFIVGKVYRAV